MRCPQCGAAVSAVLYRCGHCGTVLPPPPGVAPAQPVAAAATPAAAPHIRILDGWASAAVGLSWLAVLFLALAWLPTLREITAGRRLIAAELVGWQLVLAAGFLALYLAAAATFVTWLFLARRNLNAFPEASPAWGEPWTVTVWCVPVVALAAVSYAFVFFPEVVPSSGPWPYAVLSLPLLALAAGTAVVADVVHHSGDGSSVAERQRYAAKAWGWWLFGLATVIFPGAGLAWTVGTGFGGWQLARTGIFVTPIGVGMILGGACALLAVSRLTSIINWVSAEHRQRVERRWDGGLGQRAAAGFDAR